MERNTLAKNFSKSGCDSKYIIFRYGTKLKGLTWLKSPERRQSWMLRRIEQLNCSRWSGRASKGQLAFRIATPMGAAAATGETSKAKGSCLEELAGQKVQALAKKVTKKWINQ